MSAPSVQYTHTSDDIAIAWAERGTGAPLVVSTGSMLPLDIGWEPGGIWDRLSQSFRVIRFDPRGCGMSDRDGVWGSFHDEAIDLAAVVSAAQTPRTALMGYYIGTPAAVIAMLNEPERYTHLVLHLPVPMGGERERSPQQQEHDDLVDGTVENLLRLGWQHHEEPARRALLTADLALSRRTLAARSGPDDASLSVHEPALRPRLRTARPEFARRVARRRRAHPDHDSGRGRRRTGASQPVRARVGASDSRRAAGRDAQRIVGAVQQHARD